MTFKKRVDSVAKWLLIYAKWGLLLKMISYNLCKCPSASSSVMKNPLTGDKRNIKLRNLRTLKKEEFWDLILSMMI